MKYELIILGLFAFDTNATSLFDNIRPLFKNIHLHSLLVFQQSRRVVTQADIGLSRGSCRWLKTQQQSGLVINQVEVTPSFVTSNQMDA